MNASVSAQRSALVGKFTCKHCGFVGAAICALQGHAANGQEGGS